MRKGAERAPGAVGGVLYVVALCGLVYFRVELLLCAGVAVLALVPRIAGHGVAPLVARLHLRARGGPMPRDKKKEIV